MLAVPVALTAQRDAWLLAHSGADVDALSGVEFERCIGAMFSRLGYEVEFTETYDFGADLIVSRDGNRTAVQAKRQHALVGEHAFQQVLAGRAYYHCDSATVVTNSELMSRARKLAAESGVSIMERPALTRMLQKAGMLESPRLLGPPLCGRCGIPLVWRSGRYGPFWGCSNFPRGCGYRAEIRNSLILSLPPSQPPPVPSHEPRVNWECKPAGRWEPPAAAVAVHPGSPTSVPDTARPWSAGHTARQRRQLVHGAALAALILGWLCVFGFVVGLVEPPAGENPQTGGYVFALVLFGVPTVWGTVRLWHARAALRR